MAFNFSKLIKKETADSSDKNKVENREESDRLINMGNQFEDGGNIDSALDCYQKAQALSPQYWRTWLNLGIAYDIKNELDQALAMFRRAFELNDATHITSYNLARILHKLPHNRSELIGLLERAIQYKSDFFDAYVILAEAYYEDGQTEKALKIINRALLIQNNPDVLINKSYYLEALGKEKEAFELLKGAAEASDHAKLRLAKFLCDRGEVSQALALYRRMNAFETPVDMSAYLMTLLFSDGVNPETILPDHKKINAFFPAAPLAGKSSKPVKHIAFMSPDLHAHAVAYFIRPLLENLDKTAFKVSVYNISHTFDAISGQLKKRVENWHDVQGLSDQQLAEKIAADEVDLLVDLAGHSGDNRLGVLAAKPAPIIITWLGYLATTGLDAVDFRLVDHITDPVGLTESQHSEKLIRLPKSQWCYAPQDNLPDIQPSPCLANRFITFGSFNQTAKLSEKCLNLWAEVLKSVPDSRLFFAGVSPGWACERIIGILEKAGIAQDRLAFQGRVSWIEYFASYNQVDIALDSFPCTGATTMCDALAMGVPSLTLAGGTSVSRSGASILTALGHPEWIADSDAGFVETAANFAQNIQVSGQDKTALRQAFLNSSLVDGADFTRRFEAAIRGLQIV